MVFLRALILLLAAIVLPAQIFASEHNSINLLTLPEGAVTGERYSYLIDDSAQMNANDARQSDQWLSGANTQTVKNISCGAVWMRLRLNNPAPKDIPLKFEHTESRINKLTLYGVDKVQNRTIELGHFDLFAPVAQRPYPHHRPVFAVTAPANEVTELYFKLEYLPDVRGAIYTEFRLWQSYAFEQNHLKETSLISLFFAIHVLMGLITLSIFVVNRDRVFLFYAFYAFATVGTRAATNGMLSFLIYTDGMTLAELMMPIALYQVTIFLFAREFLQVKQVAPKWDALLKTIMTLSVVCTASVFTRYAPFIGLFSEAISAAYPIILIVSIVCWRRGVPSALLFALGWTLLLFGGIVTFAARDAGLVEHAPWSYWLAHTGALIEVFLLAGLLVSRVIRLRKEKALVESKYREHLKTYSEELKRKVEQQTVELKNAKEDAEREARTDVLTGLTNRRHFMESSLQAIERAQRNKWDIWLVTVDIDFFKRVNDTYGHAAGDTALRAVAQVLVSQIRNVDIVARIGGEEFALVIEGGGQSEALHVCERLRRSIESVPVVHGGDIIPITISIGVARKKADETLEQLVHRADKALYQAKEDGRNCVVEACT